MRIVYVVPNLKNCGPINVLFGLVRRIAKKNEVVIVCLFGDKNDADTVRLFEGCGADIKTIDLKTIDCFLSGTKALIKVLDTINPDIVHSHGLQADFVVSKLSDRYKTISTIHSNIIDDYKYQFGRLASIVLIRCRLKIMSRFTVNVCCSESVYDCLSKSVDARMTFIRNGVRIDGNKREPKRSVCNELGIPFNSKLFFYAGLFSRRKRVNELISYFISSFSNNEYLLLAGDGDEMKKCKKTAGENSHIIFLGRRKDVDRYLAISDVYVSNSASEGLPMSVLEAMSHDCLLLLSDIPSHRECLKIDPVNSYGCTFTKSNYGEKHRQIVLSIFDKPTINKELISDARMADEYLKLYRSII